MLANSSGIRVDGDCISSASLKIVTPAVFLPENNNSSGSLGNVVYADSVFAQ